MADQEKNTALTAQENQTVELEVTPEQSVVKKPAKKKKAIWPIRAAKAVARWFKDFRSEAKKVVWPSAKQVVNNTIVVIIAAVVVCIFVAILDVIFGFIRDIIASLV